MQTYLQYMIQLDPTRSNLTWSYLIEKLTKVRLMPVRMKLSPWVRLKNNHYYCLRLQRASLIIKFILDHFSLKQQLSFSLLVLHMWCFNEFFCAALTLFNVLWLKLVVCAVVLRCWEKLWKNRSCLLKNERNNVTQPQYNATRATLSLGCWLLRYKKFKSSQTESIEKQ